MTLSFTYLTSFDRHTQTTADLRSHARYWPVVVGLLLMGSAVAQPRTATAVAPFTATLQKINDDIQLYGAIALRNAASDYRVVGQTWLYLTPMHAQAGLIKSMIANVHAAISYVRRAAEQLPKLDPRNGS